MVKRILIIFLAGLALFYIYSGYHFYKKSFSGKSTFQPIEEIREIDTTKLVIIKQNTFDFESGSFNTTEDIAVSGKKSLKITPKKEYDSEYLVNISSIPNFTYFREVEISLMGLRKKKMSSPLLWVVEIVSDSGKVLSWESSGVLPISENWENFNFHIKIQQEFLLPKNVLKIYAWNKNKETLFVDDLKLSFWGYSAKINK
jgi:hypothetical protein